MAWPGLTDLLLVADRDRAAVPDLAAAGGQRLAEVLLNMRTAMEELSEAPVRHLLGGALTGAQNEGRLTAAVDADIPGSVFADETRDANTCQPCRDIDARFLGMTDEMDDVRRHYPGGGFGGYVGCEGRERCRGTIRIEWPEGLDPIDPDEPAEPDLDEFEREMEEALQRQKAENAARAAAEERAAEIERHLERNRQPLKVPDRDLVSTLTHDTDYAARVAELRRLIGREAEADQDHRFNRSGAQGLTEVINLPDRARFVSKQVKSWDDPLDRDDAATTDTDKEELAGAVARAVGVDTPAMVRAGRTHVYMEFVDGTLGAELRESDWGTVMASDGGHLMGVLDVLIANTDRNSGNWFVRDGRPVAIDHGFAWNEQVEPVTTSPFAEPFIDFGTPDQYSSGVPFSVRSSNPMSPADMALIRERVAGLRPDFERLGRVDWYDRMIGRLDEIAAAASGDRDRLAG